MLEIRHLLPCEQPRASTHFFQVLVASANMRGVREGYVHKAKQLGLDDSLPSVRVRLGVEIQAGPSYRGWEGGL